MPNMSKIRFELGWPKKVIGQASLKICIYVFISFYGLRCSIFMLLTNLKWKLHGLQTSFPEKSKIPGSWKNTRVRITETRISDELQVSSKTRCNTKKAYIFTFQMSCGPRKCDKKIAHSVCFCTGF